LLSGRAGKAVWQTFLLATDAEVDMRLSRIPALGRRSRVGVAVLVVCAGVTLWATGALAVFPDSNVDHYTGCLNTKVSPGGTFVNVAQGDSPSKACGSGQVLVHLSGGDITSVNAGTGLSGGSVNGAANVAIDPQYQLPQACTNDFVPKWVASSATWQCAADNNGGGTITGVTAGIGLTGGGTSGTVSVGVSGSYQLPQNCGNGQVAKSNGSNSWSCQDDSVGAMGDAYVASNGATQELPNDFSYVDLVDLQLPAGSYFVTARTLSQDSDNNAYVECNLDGPGGTIDQTQAEVNGEASGQIGTTNIVTLGAVSLSALGHITLDCRAATPGGAEAFLSKIVAVKVGGIH
jgi:hypothetical protein